MYIIRIICARQWAKHCIEMGIKRSWNELTLLVRFDFSSVVTSILLVEYCDFCKFRVFMDHLVIELLTLTLESSHDFQLIFQVDIGSVHQSLNQSISRNQTHLYNVKCRKRITVLLLLLLLVCGIVTDTGPTADVQCKTGSVFKYF